MKIVIPMNTFTFKLIHPHMYLFDTYWKQHPDVIFLGYGKHSEKIKNNFYFHNQSQEDIPAQKWTSFLLDFLENYYTEKNILLYLDDTFLVREVNSEVVHACNTFVDDGLADKIYLNGTLTKTPECFFLEQEKIPLTGLVEITKSSKWRNSLQTCIWKTDVLKKELRKFKQSASPWQFEEDNLDDTNNIFSFSYNYPVMISHVYRGKHLIPDWHSALSEYGEDSKLNLENIEYIKNFI